MVVRSRERTGQRGRAYLMWSQKMTLNRSDLDPSTDPGDDFYRFANGGWIDANPIPAGFGAWGSFEELTVRNDAVIADLLASAASDPQDPLDRLLGDHYAAGMDLEAIEAAGLAAIRPLLERIDALDAHDQLVDLLAELHSEGIFPYFGWDVTVDHDDASRNLLWIAETGLGLPDRDSYDATTDGAVELRAAYVDHIAAQFVNLGAEPAEAAEDAISVLDLETALAAHQMRAEERRDRSRTLNRRTIAELSALAPSLDLPSYLETVGAGAAETVNLQNPSYLAALPDLIAGAEISAIRAYLRFHVVLATADALPRAFDEESFSFFGRRIQGQAEQHTRSKRVIDALSADLGEALGQRFVSATFSEDAKQRALTMVESILEEMRRSLETRAWMGEETRARGLAKLDAMGVKIGFPDRWRDWSGLELTRTNYAANRLAAARFERRRATDKIAEPVDLAEWEMPPHVVNAYYHPTRNEIVFPAGILQPPMFDAEADDAVNLGGIGTVIAHEITHGFDDQGRQFDGDGAFREWWTAEDQERFTALTERLVDQFDDFAAIDELHVNGRLTLGENIADLGGVALAHRALLRTTTGVEPIDGWTPAQRFFLSNARIWRANISDELARTLAQVDPHSPRRLRVLGPISNLDGFQEAFGLGEDAPALRPRGERIEIW